MVSNCLSKCNHSADGRPYLQSSITVALALNPGLPRLQHLALIKNTLFPTTLRPTQPTCSCPCPRCRHGPRSPCGCNADGAWRNDDEP